MKKYDVRIRETVIHLMENVEAKNENEAWNLAEDYILGNKPQPDGVNLIHEFGLLRIRE